MSSTILKNMISVLEQEAAQLKPLKVAQADADAKLKAARHAADAAWRNVEKRKMKMKELPEGIPAEKMKDAAAGAKRVLEVAEVAAGAADAAKVAAEQKLAEIMKKNEGDVNALSASKLRTPEL